MAVGLASIVCGQAHHQIIVIMTDHVTKSEAHMNIDDWDALIDSIFDLAGHLIDHDKPLKKLEEIQLAWTADYWLDIIYTEGE